MKFRDGFWQIRKGFNVYKAVDVRDTRREADRLTVYAASRVIQNKGDTLNTPMLKLEYSSPLEDVIRVRLVHHSGTVEKSPCFDLSVSQNRIPEISLVMDKAEIKSGKLSAVMNARGEFSCSFSYDGKALTGQYARGTGFVQSEDGTSYIRQELSLGAGELAYGLGERFGAFCRNGQAVDIWNEDGGTASEQAYKNIPFYLSNRGYGVFVNHPGRVMFEVASEVVPAVQFAVEEQELEFYVIGGESLKQVISNYTALSGRPALPPAWSFGLWLSTSFLTEYDEKTVNSFIDGMAERDLPLSVFHFDCFWMKEFQWCDFVWNSDIFPDPAAMLKRLKEKGLRICVWINPFIAQKSPLFAKAAAGGYLLRTPEGAVRQADDWQAGMGYVDFTNPEAAAWFQSKLKALLDMGVDCFKTDFGERIPIDVVYHDGSDPVLMHNFYTFLYNRTVFELLQKVKGKEEAIVFARSACTGSQQFPVHWGGDCTATYASMAETLRGGLSLGMAGFGFWSHDIAGFEMTATPDLYKRWTAFGLLSSHSRLHGSTSYRVPWLFDDEAVDVLRFFTKLKLRLMPYLYAQAAYAAESGVPLLRAMLLEFPDDPGCAYLDRQYMFGDALLVAPVFNEDSTIQVYLPAGNWTHLLDGECYDGGRWYDFSYNYYSLGLFAAPDSIIIMGNNDTQPVYNWTVGSEIHLFGPADGAEASCAVVDSQGKEVNKLKAVRIGSRMILEAERGMDASAIILHNEMVKACDTGLTVQDGYNGVLRLKGEFTRIEFELDDR
ncbi:MAG: alpha-xylosidase [Spirochaetales bacterium]|nr:alpha-xylosidase [Spirochaetales bacterium]